MADALQKLLELSKLLQHRSIGLSYANKKLKIGAALIEERKPVPKFYSSMAQEEVVFLWHPFPQKRRQKKHPNLEL